MTYGSQIRPHDLFTIPVIYFRHNATGIAVGKSRNLCALFKTRYLGNKNVCEFITKGQDECES